MEVRWEGAKALLRRETVSSKACHPAPWRGIPVPVPSLGGQRVVRMYLILDRTVSLDALGNHSPSFCRNRENRQKVSPIILPLCQKKIKGPRIQSKVRYFGYFTLKCGEYHA